MSYQESKYIFGIVFDRGCGQILGPAMTGGIKMSFTEEEKKKALQLYDETGSIAKVIDKLGLKIEILKRNTRNIVLLIHQTIGYIYRWKQNLKYFTFALKKEKT